MTTSEPASDGEREVQDLAAAGRWDDATAAALRRYGPELLEYLVAIGRSHTDGGDAFAAFAVDLWKGLPRFRWESSLRTWCYRLARNALARVQRAPIRRRAVALESKQLADLADQIRTRTLDHLRTDVKDRVRALRERLSAEDQSILILRIDRDLAWRDIARVLADDEELAEAVLVKRAAALRKRFERIKEDLRALAKAEGIGSRDE